MAILVLAVNAFGQDSEKPSTQYAGRSKHNIQLNVGLLFDTEVDNEVMGGVSNRVSNDGFIGSISYWYWSKQELAVGLAVAVLGSEVSNAVIASEVFNETASVIPVLLGFKYQPRGMALSDDFRGYFSAAIGPCFGFGTSNRAGSVVRNETFSETALATHFALGVDLSISKLITLGFGAGYYLMTDFDRRVGSRENYSSPELTIFFGFNWGR